MQRVIDSARGGLIARAVLAIIRKSFGMVPQSKRLAAHHTPTLVAASWLDGLTDSAVSTPLALKKLAQLKVSMMIGCPF